MKSNMHYDDQRLKIFYLHVSLIITIISRFIFIEMRSVSFKITNTSV